MLKSRFLMLAMLLVLVLGAVFTMPVQAATTYSISGTILWNGVGLRGVTVSISGTTLTATTNSLGNYSIHYVPLGTSGNIVPKLTYFTFSPTSIAFTNLAGSLTGKNFTATMPTPVYFSISGKITYNGNPLAGVLVKFNTFSATTSTLGTYTITGVPYGSKGRIVPSLSGYAFTPAYITIAWVSSNLANENFTAAPAYTISGKVTDKTTLAPVGGVTVTCGTHSAVTNSTYGTYTIKNLPAGTSCILTPSLSGKTFTPINITITNLQANLHSQNFVAAP